MPDRLETLNIYKHVMNAPPTEPLTLSPPMLMLLREWMGTDARTLSQLRAEALLIEHDRLVKQNARLSDELSRLQTSHDILFQKLKNVNSYVFYTDSCTMGGWEVD